MYVTRRNPLNSLRIKSFDTFAFETCNCVVRVPITSINVFCTQSEDSTARVVLQSDFAWHIARETRGPLQLMCTLPSHNHVMYVH